MCFLPQAYVDLKLTLGVSHCVLSADVIAQHHVNFALMCLKQTCRGALSVSPSTMLLVTSAVIDTVVFAGLGQLSRIGHSQFYMVCTAD